MMFGEHGFLDRFAAARNSGFKAVEFLFPYDFSPEQVGKAVHDNGLAISVFNLFPETGRRETGEWPRFR